jgi:hypothetical protein
MMNFTAKAIKTTMVLNAAEVVAAKVGDSGDFVVNVGAQKITGRFNTKTVRKVMALIHEHGPDAVVVIAQGKLVNGRLEEAGIVGQIKTPKPQNETIHRT